MATRERAAERGLYTEDRRFIQTWGSTDRSWFRYPGDEGVRKCMSVRSWLHAVGWLVCKNLRGVCAMCYHEEGTSSIALITPFFWDSGPTQPFQTLTQCSLG